VTEDDLHFKLSTGEDKFRLQAKSVVARLSPAHLRRGPGLCRHAGARTHATRTPPTDAHTHARADMGSTTQITAPPELVGKMVAKGVRFAQTERISSEIIPLLNPVLYAVTGIGLSVSPRPCMCVCVCVCVCVCTRRHVQRRAPIARFGCACALACAQCHMPRHSRAGTQNREADAEARRWRAGLWLLNKHESGAGGNVGQKSDKMSLDTTLTFDDIAGIDDSKAQVAHSTLRLAFPLPTPCPLPLPLCPPPCPSPRPC
jgi:hypothetical protein